MKSPKKIPLRNRNHTGWWLYGEVEYHVTRRQKKLVPGSQCLVWENLRLIKAGNRDQAYRKAIKLSSEVSPSKTGGGEWRFAGISMLLPIYNELKDGAEILWTDRRFMTVSALQKLIKKKHQLEAFDDRERME
jgi:hypothetical protein